MTTKTYKTVSGYLRSADERMRGKIPWNASDDLRIAGPVERFAATPNSKV